MGYNFQDIRTLTQVAFQKGYQNGLLEISTASGGLISQKTSYLATKYVSGFNFIFNFSLRATPGFNIFTDRTPAFNAYTDRFPYTDLAQVNERRPGDNILLRARSDEFGNDAAWKNFIDGTPIPNCYISKKGISFILVDWR